MSWYAESGQGVEGQAKELARQTAVDQPLPMKD